MIHSSKSKGQNLLSMQDKFQQFNLTKMEN
jgi:hypothetical protein